MTLIEWLRTIFTPRRAAPVFAATPAPTRARATNPARALGGGRVSVDMPDTVISNSWIMVPPADYESNWRTLNLDAKHLDLYTPKELLDMLADLSPELSRAVWDFLRLCNPGWEVKAYRVGSDKTEDTAAQAALDDFLDALKQQYGSVDIVLGRLFMGAYMRGAFCAELVLDRGRVPVDLATPDPYSIKFRKRPDPIRGQVWQPGQWQPLGFVPLDIPTFRYMPVDPAPGVPYGRPLAAPALFTTIFLLGLMHDLKRVVMQQGYPRLDLSIVQEKAMLAYQQSPGNFETFDAYMAAAVAAVNDVYSQLEPDDAYIHSDTVMVNRPVGTVDASSLGSLEGIIDNLELMATRALKSMPLLMGLNVSASDTDSNRMWELHIAGIKSIQHYCEALLESLLTLALEAQGLQARVEFRFAEVRAAEELRDAQTEQLRIANEKEKYAAGWVEQDEASLAITGHEAVEEEPRQAAVAPGQPQQDNNDGNEALNRGRDLVQTRVKLIPDGAGDPLPAIPDQVTISDNDIDRALKAWDALMPDYAGLLAATVVGQSEFDEDSRQIGAAIGADGQLHPVRYHVRAAGDPSPWLWSPTAHRYRDPSTGRFVGQRQMTELRDQFTAAQRGKAAELGTRLASGDLTLQQWELALRAEVKTAFVDQYVLGKGGRSAMTQADWGAAGRMLRDQYGFLHDFAGEIAQGKLSGAQIEQRGRAYIDAATQAFERGRGASYGVPSLPQYPADGATRCRSNCRCRWAIVETDEAWECTWVLDRAAEHCTDCADNADRWNPLVIAKGGRNREQIERILEGMTNGHH